MPSRFGAVEVEQQPRSRFGAVFVEDSEIPDPPPAPPTEAPSGIAQFLRGLGDTTLDLAGAAVPGEYGRQSRARLAANVAPETVKAFEQDLAQTVPGDIALSASEGAMTAADQIVSGASRSLGSGDAARTLYRQKQNRQARLAGAQENGALTQTLGDGGAKFLRGVSESLTGMGLTAPLGSVGAIGSAVHGVFQDEVSRAEAEGKSGLDAVTVGLQKATIEGGITFLMGRLGSRLGWKSLEEAIASPGLRKAVTDLAAKAVPKTLLARAAKEAGGMTLEAAEEALIDMATQGVEYVERQSNKFDWGRVLSAGAGGIAARGLTGAAKEIHSRLKALPKTKLTQTAKGVKAAEDRIEAGDLDPSKLAQATTAKEFEAVTGLKGTSQEFRQAYRSTMELAVEPEQATTVSPEPAPPDASAVASEAAGTTPEPPAGETPVEGSQEPPVDRPPTGGEPIAIPGDSGAPDGEFSARRAEVDRRRELTGLDEIPSPATRSWQSVLNQAMDDGIPARALDLAEDVVANPRAFSDVETAGLVVRSAEVIESHDSAVRGMEGVTDPADLRIRAAEVNRLETELDTLTKALRASGTEKGRALAAQKLTINKNYDLASVITRAKAAKGTALSDPEREQLAGTVRDFERKKAKAEHAAATVKRLDTEREHREVARLRSAVSSIRKQLGLDAPSEAAVAVPGLSVEDQAKLDAIQAKLAEADSMLAQNELPERERVHHRPSEESVSDLDDMIARTRAEMRRRLNFVDSNTAEQNRIAKLEQRLADAQETLRKARAGEPIDRSNNRRYDVATEQRQKLEYELAKARQEIRDAINSHRPRTFWNRAQTLTDISRGLITSIDLSALGRQAKFAVWSHPRIAANNFGDMIRAFASDRAAYDIEQEILSRPNAPLYDLGMTIHRRDATLSNREEAFTAKALEQEYMNVGGRKVFNPIAGSQRAYVTFVNKMRADVFDTLAKAYGGDAGLSHEQYKQLGHLINVFTGRGGFAAADQHMRTASLALFAPRYLLSRVQFAIGEPMWRSDPEIRKIARQEYARTLIGAAVWYSLYALAFGGDDRFSITFDPRSADFGKIVVGDTRMDPLAGLAQVSRFVAQMVTGQKSTNGYVEDMSPRDKGDAIWRFARSKASPILGQALNLMSGEDVARNPVNLTTPEGASNLALGLVAPLSLRDTTDAIEDQGLPRGVALNILNLLGEGMQVYGE